MWSIIVPSVLIPLLFTAVMSAMEALARPVPFWEKIVDVGWDLCILGMGVTGGIFASPLIEAKFGTSNAMLTGVIVLAVDLGFATAILFLKKGAASRVKGTISVALGVLAVGVPSGLTFWR